MFGRAGIATAVCASDRHTDGRKPLGRFRRAPQRVCEIERGAGGRAPRRRKEKWHLSARLEQIRHQCRELISIGLIGRTIMLGKKCLQRHVRAFQQNAVIDEP